MIEMEALENEYRRLLKMRKYRAPHLADWVKTQLIFEAQANKWTESEEQFETTKDNEPHALELPIGLMDGTPPTNEVVIWLAEAVEKAATEWNFSVPMPVLCRVFPTTFFNAQSRVVGESRLLLINEGLVHLIFGLSEIYGLSVDLVDPNKPRPESGVSLSKEESVEGLATLIYSYLFSEQGVPETAYPMIGGVQGHWIIYLCQTIIKFVVAHEYGHLYANHLTTAEIRESSSNGDGFNIIRKDWQQEYEADIFAMRLMLPPSKRNLDSFEKHFDASTQLVGPLAFFQLQKLIESTQELLNDNDIGSIVITDHPPAETRTEKIREWASMIKAETLMEHADRFFSWIEDLRTDIVETVVSRRNQRRDTK